MSPRPSGVAAYIAVTAAYWAFMLTDGALRMLVLLHFHTLGFTSLELAWLFLLYEAAGVVTNLCAGWIAKRFGLMTTLYAGLALQIAALFALTRLDPAWSVGASVIFVMAVQGASGVAKDLTKMSSKSAVKLLAPTEGDGLFRWVALLTGSKNAVKGAGFFLGSALLWASGFNGALWTLLAALGVVLGLIAAFAPAGLSGGAKGAKFREVFSTSRAVNTLSAARLFLFGARDAWFVVGAPIWLYGVFASDGGGTDGAAFAKVGAFMAAWIIFYGAVQASAPRLIGARGKSLEDLAGMAQLWVAGLAFIPLALTCALWIVEGTAPATLVIGGLFLFGAVFAVNSSLHSYLILAFTSDERVTMDVGFYYMSNAAGRLLGTLISGLSYQWGGLPGCLLAAAAMAGVSWLCARRLEP